MIFIYSHNGGFSTFEEILQQEQQQQLYYALLNFSTTASYLNHKRKLTSPLKIKKATTKERDVGFNLQSSKLFSLRSSVMGSDFIALWLFSLQILF